MGNSVFDEQLRGQVGSLTSRQLEILTLIGQGLSTVEIAKRLHRTAKTIESHRSMLGKKLGARNRVELALIALRAGLCELSESKKGQSSPPSTSDASTREVLRHTPAEHALRAIDAATCATTGQDFLDALVAQLAIVFNAQCAAVLKLDETNRLQSIAAATPDGRKPQVSFPFVGCPCEHAQRAEVRSIYKGLCEQFPHIQAFGDLGAQGILLTPLYDSKGERLGTLMLLHGGDLDESMHPEIVVRIFAGRVAAELERLANEQTLRLNEQRYRLLADHSGDLITRITPDAGITYVSPACRELLGLEAQAMLGRSVYEFIHPDDHESVRHAHEAVLHDRERATVVHRMHRYDGSISWFETKLAAHRNERGVVQWLVGASRDITARKAAEEKLIRSERLLSEAERIAHLGCWEWDVRRNRTTWSDETYRIFGYAPQAFKPTCEEFRSRLHPDDAARVMRAIEEAVEAGSSFDCEFRIVLPGGEVRHVHERAEFACGPDGQPLLIGTAHDVTERKLAEAAIVASEQRFRDIVRADSDWIWEIDADDAYTYCSEAISSILGYSVSDVLGRTPFDLMPPEEATRVRAEFDRIKNQRLPFRDLENWNLRNDGQLVCLLTSGVPVLDAAGNLVGYRGVDRDITERKRTEEALRISESNLIGAQAVAHVGSWHLDLLTDELTWTPEAYRLFKIPLGTPLTYEKFLTRVHPADRAAVQRAWEAALRGEPYDIEHRILIEGDVRWVRERAVVEFADDGSPLSALGSVQDISDLKAVEQQLWRNQSMLAHAERIAQIGSWEWDVRSDRAHGSDQLCSLLGVTQETFPRTLATLLDRTVHPDDRAHVEQAFRHTAEHGGRLHVQAKILVGNGQTQLMEAIGDAVRAEGGLVRRILGITRLVPGGTER